MHSDIAIDIDAPDTLILALAADVERWATLVPHSLRSSAHFPGRTYPDLARKEDPIVAEVRAAMALSSPPRTA